MMMPPTCSSYALLDRLDGIIVSPGRGLWEGIGRD